MRGKFPLGEGVVLINEELPLTGGKGEPVVEVTALLDVQSPSLLVDIFLLLDLF